MPSDQAKQEVATFEYNAKEGLRAAAFFWFVRKVLRPYAIAWFLLPVVIFMERGLVPGIMSAIFLSMPLVLLLLIAKWQGTKVLDYWRK